MAWMSMMGAGSVDYARQALAAKLEPSPGFRYFESQGQTPLTWGGAGAERLGLRGLVSEPPFDSIYGPGGAVDPVLGTRLVSTKRPGMELVVAAHKSVAELGVIGRHQHMHQILDAESAATVDYLERITMERGGRRGKAAVPTPTTGLIYARTRHATTRSGDPGPHDHVVIANAVEMLDGKGGWKAPNTTLWRDHLHAATMIGRLHAAWTATQLDYALTPDNGRSGRLGHWAIAGIPKRVLDLHSKRSTDIEIEAELRGHDTYRARNIAARDTRAPKENIPWNDALPGWQRELAESGHPVSALQRSIDRASRARQLSPTLTPSELNELVGMVVAPDGPLAQRKVFARRDVIVAVAPRLYGRHPGQLEVVLDAVYAHRELVPLLARDGCSERVHTLGSVLAIEQAIAQTVSAGMTRTDAPTVEHRYVAGAIVRQHAQLRAPLTAGQHALIHGVCASGRGVELVVGIAGTGKTTALKAIGDAYTAAGYTVVGTSTSGQAARTLQEAADIPSRTLASLLWRIDHHQLTLDSRTVLILDEAGMTDDPDLNRVLTAARVAGSKVVLVGDDRQLSPVGPGGGLGALIDRWDPAVHWLTDNIRQHNPAERVALAELRHGDVDRAIAWMTINDRIETAETRPDTHALIIDRWYTDVAARKETVMLAWRRSDVDQLNWLAHHRMRAEGRLTGPILGVDDGLDYQSGDRIVTLAPSQERSFVTSERGTVTDVDLDQRALWVRFDDGRRVPLVARELDPDRLAHGYAITVHRAQGATVDTAHVHQDGGGRELAYVKTSRAREHTTVYVTADDLDQAREDLQRDWTHQTRQQWVTDTHQSGTTPDNTRRHELTPLQHAARRIQLEAEQWAVNALVPPDVRRQLVAAQHDRSHLLHRVEQLRDGRYYDNSDDLRRLALARDHADTELDRAQRAVELATRRRARNDAIEHLETAQQNYALVDQQWLTAIEPVEQRLHSDLEAVSASVDELTVQHQQRREWLRQHPEAARRLDHLDRTLPPTLEHGLDLGQPIAPRHAPEPRGPDLGLGL
jgi:conjugative relaxase-like TrwC/TraI family protein